MSAHSENSALKTSKGRFRGGIGDRPLKSSEIDLNPVSCSVSIKSAEVASHYRAIGEALLACEAVSWKVGIPWLPPTSRVRRLRAHPEWRDSKNLGDFLRRKMVGIKTEVLESYCDDLESLPPEQHSSQLLGIRLTSRFERYLLADAATVISLAAGYAFFRAILGRAIFSFVPALICSGMIGLVGTTVSSEAYRRTSFYSLLTTEISRRRGDVPSSGKSVQMYSAEPV